MPYAFDETDARLLQLLQHDGRATVRMLAQEVGLSPSGCMRRIQMLEENGVITGYAAKLTPEAVGLTMQAIVHVELEKTAKTKLHEFYAEVQDWPEVLACYAVTGDCDCILHVAGPDLASLKDFVIERLGSNSSIARVSTSVVLDVPKRSIILPLSHLIGGTDA